MLRLLAFDFRNDPNTYNVRDEFMFGPAFLVCPITEPMDPAREFSEREIYLPAGADWYDLWTGDRWAGGQTISAGAQLYEMPVYIRAGSIVPMTQLQQYVDEHPKAPVELHIFDGQDGAFQLYEDAGDGYDYEGGGFATIDIRWIDGTHQLIIGERQGHYPSMQKQREFIIVLGIYRKTVAYTGGELTIEMP